MKKTLLTLVAFFVLGIVTLSAQTMVIDFTISDENDSNFVPVYTDNTINNTPMVTINGVRCMWAGDADGSGGVDAADRSEAWNNRNQLNYNTSDFDLSGGVDAADRSIAWNNRNKQTHVPNSNNQ